MVIKLLSGAPERFDVHECPSCTREHPAEESAERLTAAFESMAVQALTGPVVPCLPLEEGERVDRAIDAMGDLSRAPDADMLGSLTRLIAAMRFPPSREEVEEAEDEDRELVIYDETDRKLAIIGADEVALLRSMLSELGGDFAARYPAAVAAYGAERR